MVKAHKQAKSAVVMEYFDIVCGHNFLKEISIYEP